MHTLHTLPDVLLDEQQTWYTTYHHRSYIDPTRDRVIKMVMVSGLQLAVPRLLPMVYSTRYIVSV